MSGELFCIESLCGYLAGQSGLRPILDGVDLCIHSGETTALLGESGSGKTFLALSVLGLHPGMPGLVSGVARVMGIDVLGDLWHCVEQQVVDGTLRVAKDPPAWTRGIHERLQPVLGRAVNLVPQDPLTTLPPFYTVGELMEQALRRGDAGISRSRARQVARQWLDRVHMYGVDEVLSSYPHELSGGMAQRVALALALAPGPELLIADEPTTGLDATLRVRILELLSEAVHSLGVTLFLTTHDAEAARMLVKHVAVLCGGRIVERGPTERVLDSRVSPKHPYTRYLLEAEARLAGGPVRQPVTAAAAVAFGEGCGYRDCCPLADDLCAGQKPPLVEVAGGRGETATHHVACWREAG